MKQFQMVLVQVQIGSVQLSLYPAEIPMCVQMSASENLLRKLRAEREKDQEQMSWDKGIHQKTIGQYMWW